MIFDGDRDGLGQYVREMADQMGLRDWTIHLLNEPPEDSKYAADIDVLYGRRVGCLRVHREWPSASPEELRSTIVHELVHCHINPARNVIDNMQHAIGQTLYMTAYNALTDHIEYAVDAIATAWAETLPLPVKADDEAEAA